MTGYQGYFLQGLASGIQSGVNMKQQMQEMKWKKAQMKQLEDKQLKIEEGAAAYNKLVEQVNADGVISEDEMMKLETAYLAAGYEVQAVIKDSHEAIQTMNKNKVEQDFEWLDMWAEMIDGLPPNDIQGAYDIVKPNIKSEKGLSIFEAYNSLKKKRYEVEQKQPEDVWGQAGTLPSEYRPGYLQSKGIDIPQPTETPKTPGISDYKGAVDYLSKFLNASPQTFNAIKAGLQKQFPNIDMSAITQESLREPEGVAGGVTEPEPETVSTLKNWEQMFDIEAEEGPKTEEEYNRALNLLAQSKDNYKPKYPTWKEALIAEAKGIAKELEGITDKKDRTLLLDVYKRKLEEIKTKYPEVNLEQFPVFEEQKNWFEKLLERGKYKLGL